MAGKNINQLTGPFPSFLQSIGAISLGGRQSPAHLIHPIVAQLKGMKAVDKLEVPVSSPSGTTAKFSASFVDQIVWHPWRAGIAVITDDYGNLLIVDVLRRKTMHFETDADTSTMDPIFHDFLCWDPAEPIGGNVLWFLLRHRSGVVYRIRFPLFGNGEYEKTDLVNLQHLRNESLACVVMPWCATFQPDGNTIVLGCTDGSIRLVDKRRDYEIQGTWKVHGNCVQTVALDPSNPDVVFSHDPCDASLIDIRETSGTFPSFFSRVTPNYARRPNELVQLEFSRTSQDHFLISDRVGSITVFSSTNLQRVASFPATGTWTRFWVNDDNLSLGYVRASWHPLANFVCIGEYPSVYSRDENSSSAVVRLYNVDDLSEVCHASFPRCDLVTHNVFNCDGSHFMGSTQASWSGAPQDTWLLQRRPDDDENDKEAGTDNARGSDDVNHDGEGLSGHFGRALTI